MTLDAARCTTLPAIVLALAVAAPVNAQQAAINARMLPDISAVGDMIADFSPKRSTQNDGTRFGIRHVEIAVQAPVDPYFRGDIFLGFTDAEGVHIEEAFLTATSLPAMIEARLGRFRMPVGKQNTTHEHDLHSIEFPHVIQRFFGEEGLSGTGVYASRVFDPFGFYQEIIVTAVDRLGGHGHAHEEEEHDEGEDGHEHEAIEPVNSKLSGLGYTARLRNYWDLTEAANVELSASVATGKQHQPFGDEEVSARQTLIGADVTYRWRPAQQGLYKSLIIQAEVMRQLNAVPDGLDETLYLGPTQDYTGGYAFARYQLGRRIFVAARGDYLENAGAENGVADDAGTLKAGSAYVEFFPSEFSKLVAGYERLAPERGEAVDRITLQAAFSVGPHKPHPF